MNTSGYIYFVIKKNTTNKLIIDANTLYRIKKYGGSSVVYIIHCPNCLSNLFEYQKDGNGPLLRCYKDRIIFTYDDLIISVSGTLMCKKCDTSISSPMSTYIKKCEIYSHNESRDAFEFELI